MIHEKELARENGTKYRIQVRARTEWHSDSIHYAVGVFQKEKGKRTWCNLHNSDDYAWRRLQNEDRAKYEMGKYLEHVTASEIQEVKLELWEKLKPTQP